MSKNKKNLIRIIVSCVLFAAILVLYKFTPLKDFAIVEKDGFNIAEGIKDYRFWVYLLSFVAVYAVIGYDVVIKGVKNVFSAGFLDENFLMTIATVGAFFIADYPEAIAVRRAFPELRRGEIEEVHYRAYEYLPRNGVRTSRR